MRDGERDRPGECLVQLRYATLPSLFRAIAVHHWFAVWDPEAARWERWEVWQTRDAGGTSWGHLHRDLMHPDRPVGGGPPRIEAEWRGDEARALYRVLQDPASYPYQDRYHAWPGPNSNTYAAWVLRRAGIPYELDPRAVGKDYLGLCGSSRCLTGVGRQWESPLLGLRVDPSCVELHLLCLTFGLGLRPLSLRTPFGKVAALRKEQKVESVMRDA